MISPRIFLFNLLRIYILLNTIWMISLTLFPDDFKFAFWSLAEVNLITESDLPPLLEGPMTTNLEILSSLFKRF